MLHAKFQPFGATCRPFGTITSKLPIGNLNIGNGEGWFNYDQVIIWMCCVYSMLANTHFFVLPCFAT